MVYFNNDYKIVIMIIMKLEKLYDNSRVDTEK